MIEKYLESIAHWHRQGWHVESFDWRGQGGSGRYPTPAPCGDISDFSLYITDLEAFAGEWRRGTPGPHVVIGHSMGGHLILRALVEQRISADAAILIAPMLGLKSPFGARWSEALARGIARFGNPVRPAWRGNERPASMASRQLLLTHDPERYQDELWWHEQQPGLWTGPPSWRWLIQAFRSARMLDANPALRTMAVPLLALIADADGLVDPHAARSVLSKLPQAQIVRFGQEAAHELLREKDQIRDHALVEIDAFLAARARRS